MTLFRLYKIKYLAVLASILLTLGCSNSTSDSHSPRWQTIKGRDESKEPIYRIKVPPDWTRRDPLPEDSLSDTTKPLCEFYVQEEQGFIRISIHNFPANHLNERIPPTAQIARWQRQFQAISPEQANVIPQSFSGFSGLLFEGAGWLNGDEAVMLGWSMQIAPAHFQALSYPETAEEKQRFPQMRGDFTIKVLGPKELVKKHYGALVAFARSFELIEDL